MARVTKAMQIAEYCDKLRTELGFERAHYEYEEWNTLKILDGGQFHFNDENNMYALYDFREELSAECVKKLGACRFKRLMNEHLVSVWFNCPISDSSIRAHMNGQTAKLPTAYANCTKLIPISRDVFRGMDVNEDGMFEIDLTPSYYGKFCFSSNEFPKKNGRVTFPLRLRLSGGLPTGPVNFQIDCVRNSHRVDFSCGGESYAFFVETDDDNPIVEIKKWRARKDEEGAYLDVLMEMSYFGYGRWN